MRKCLPMFLISAFLIAPAAAYAQGLDGADVAVRVELALPEGLQPLPATFMDRLRSLIGARRVTRVRPEIGTEFTVQSSAYASSPYQTDSTPCITAAGTRVRPGVVASNFLPLGTLLEINGQEFIVEDRMNPRYDGYYLDIWFPSTSSALQFGRRNLNIRVVGYVEPGDAIREEPEPEVAEEVEEQGILVRIRDTFSAVGSLLRSQKPSVDQFDIDCLPEEDPEIPIEVE